MQLIIIYWNDILAGPRAPNKYFCDTMTMYDNWRIHRKYRRNKLFTFE